MAVKKALVAVSRCLQDCPPLDRDPIPSSRPAAPVVGEKASHEAFPDPHAEFFPHLSSLLPSLSINSGSSTSNARLPSMNIDGDPTLDRNGTWKEVVFRLLCSNAAAGAVIGKKGAIVRALQNQSGAAITFAAPAVQSGERVVTISAFEVSHAAVILGVLLMLEVLFSCFLYMNFLHTYGTYADKIVLAHTP